MANDKELDFALVEAIKKALPSDQAAEVLSKIKEEMDAWLQAGAPISGVKIVNIGPEKATAYLTNIPEAVWLDGLGAIDENKYAAEYFRVTGQKPLSCCPGAPEEEIYKKIFDRLVEIGFKPEVIDQILIKPKSMLMGSGPQKSVGRHEALGAHIGAIVDEKSYQYGANGGAGDAVACISDIMKSLYPNGVKPEQYTDFCLLVRDMDKNFRIARGNKNAFNENAWLDKVGYALRGVALEEDRIEDLNTNKAENDYDGG